MIVIINDIKTQKIQWNTEMIVIIAKRNHLKSRILTELTEDGKSAGIKTD